MKPVVRKCECGRVSNPITLSIVSDTWVKNDTVYYEFNCPQCTKKNVVRQVWDETINLGTNRFIGRGGKCQLKH